MELPVQNGRSKAGWRRLEPDTDSALNEPWVLPILNPLGSQTLIQQVAGIEDRLNFTGQDSPGWNILGNGNTKARIVVLNQSLIRIEARYRSRRGPAINGSNFRLCGVNFRLEPYSDHLDVTPG